MYLQKALFLDQILYPSKDGCLDASLVRPRGGDVLQARPGTT
jgi:hypothetical protein